MCNNEEKDNLNKLIKELNKKNINICEDNNHIIINEQDFAKNGPKMAYKDLKCFDFAEFSDFLHYEQWLEGLKVGDKER